MSTDRLGRLPTIALAVVVPVVALVTVVVTLNVTDDPSSSAASNATGGSGTAVSIKNFQYSPNPITVQAGAKVTVTNDDGSFDTGDLDGGASGTITIAKPGTYGYFCDIHNYMTGTLEVR